MKLKLEARWCDNSVGSPSLPEVAGNSRVTQKHMLPAKRFIKVPSSTYYSYDVYGLVHRMENDRAPTLVSIRAGVGAVRVVHCGLCEETTQDDRVGASVRVGGKREGGSAELEEERRRRRVGPWCGVRVRRIST